MSSRSWGQRKSPGWTLSIRSRRSRVYRPVGTNGGGLGESDGISARGSPMIFRTIRNLSGRSAMTGRTLRATGLYFRFPKVETCRSWVSVVSTGIRRVRDEIDAVDAVVLVTNIQQVLHI